VTSIVWTKYSKDFFFFFFFSKHLLFSTEECKSDWFRMTWQWVNNHCIFIHFYKFKFLCRLSLWISEFWFTMWLYRSQIISYFSLNSSHNYLFYSFFEAETGLIIFNRLLLEKLFYSVGCKNSMQRCLHFFSIYLQSSHTAHAVKLNTFLQIHPQIHYFVNLESEP